MSSLEYEIISCDMEEGNNLKNLFNDLVKQIFNEECIVYVDKAEDYKYLIEVNFEDYNFYEIGFNGTGAKEVLLQRIIDNLINERLLNKQLPGINRNNERYFKNRGL